MEKRTIRVAVDGGGGVGSKTFVWGVVITDENTKEILHFGAGVVESETERTNNIAEYQAMRTGLAIAFVHSDNVKKVILQGDSQLIMYQIQGNYECRKHELIPYYNACKRIVNVLKEKDVEIEYNWVKRECNKGPDELGRQIRDQTNELKNMVL